MSEPVPIVTVAVPLLDEIHHLPGLLTAILAQTHPASSLQVLLLDGGSRDGTQRLVMQAAAAHAQIRYLDRAGCGIAAALNTALEHAEGEYLVRLDARTRPAPTYIEYVIKRLQQGDWAAVAGPQRAEGDSPPARVHALALNHRFGTGAPRYRLASHPIESETLYLGAYPLVWLRRMGGWDENFAANEDFDLNARVRVAGGRLLVDPAIESTYLARDSLKAIAIQYANFGAWRTVTMKRHLRATQLRHLIPALFVAALVLFLLLTPVTVWPLLSLVVPYMVVDGVVSIQLCVVHRTAAFPRLVTTFLIIHLSWGVSFWIAWLRPPNQ
ncbi:MAG: glycosyltransferase [Chloroflexi bacterium]|nr:glycosyltransferase [Chloroflexota bacterium]